MCLSCRGFLANDAARCVCVCVCASLALVRSCGRRYFSFKAPAGFKYFAEIPGIPALFCPPPQKKKINEVFSREEFPNRFVCACTSSCHHACETCSRFAASPATIKKQKKRSRLLGRARPDRRAANGPGACVAGMDVHLGGRGGFCQLRAEALRRGSRAAGDICLLILIFGLLQPRLLLQARPPPGAPPRRSFCLENRHPTTFCGGVHVLAAKNMVHADRTRLLAADAGIRRGDCPAARCRGRPLTEHGLRRRNTSSQTHAGIHIRLPHQVLCAATSGDSTPVADNFFFSS